MDRACSLSSPTVHFTSFYFHFWGRIYFRKLEKLSVLVFRQEELHVRNQQFTVWK